MAWTAVMANKNAESSSQPPPPPPQVQPNQQQQPIANEQEQEPHVHLVSLSFPILAQNFILGDLKFYVCYSSDFRVTPVAFLLRSLETQTRVPVLATR